MVSDPNVRFRRYMLILFAVALAAILALKVFNTREHARQQAVAGQNGEARVN